MRINNTKVHLIGIGGAGMCGLAEVLHAMGCCVSGSDREVSSSTQRLESLGIAVQYTHEPLHVKHAQIVVYSSAIRQNNPERMYAEQAGLRQMRRAEVVGDLMRGSTCIGVAGTHGKTTTSSLTNHLLMQAGCNPTFLGGGTVRGLGANAVLGSGGLMVVEADEFDRSFLAMFPTIAVITNIEAEHLDTYGTFAGVKEAFTAYAARVPFYGTVVACIDDEGVRSVLPDIHGTVVTYGFNADAQVRAEGVTINRQGSTFTVTRQGVPLGTVTLPLPGRHNVLNALAAICAATLAGVSFETAAAAAASFSGVKRRFEIAGESKGVTVVDDYAHHPGEISATLAAARAMGFSRVVAVFQPHLFTRTRDLMDGFAAALAVADVVIVTAIYQSREEVIPGVSAEGIVKGIAAAGHDSVRYVQDKNSVCALLVPQLCSGDVVVVMGAGDIGKICPVLLEEVARGSV